MLHDHGNMLSSNHWSVIVGKCAHLWNSLYMYIYVCVKTPQNSWKTVPLLTHLAFVKSEFVETFIISTTARKCFFTTYTNHSCWHTDVCIRVWGNHSSLGNPPVWLHDYLKWLWRVSNLGHSSERQACSYWVCASPIC